MRTVDIGIRHNDYFVIAQLFNIEFVSDTRSERDYYGVELIISVNLVRSCLFDVQHFSPERKNCLEAAVTTLRCGAARRVTLDDIYLGKGSVSFVAVAELIRHLTGIKPRFSSRRFSRLARGFSRS